MKEKDKIINEYAKIINETKKEYQKLCAENIKYRDKLKRQQEHDQQEYKRQMREKEMYEKQRERDKWYIRRSRKPEVKKYSCYSESEPEAYYNYGHDESEGKPLPPKQKIKKDRRNLSEEKKWRTRRGRRGWKQKWEWKMEGWKTNEIE